MNSIYEFLDMVAKMRYSQKKLAESLDPINRSEARKAEKEVDQWLAENGIKLQTKEKTKLPTLFS
jgi:hypothetical protein